MNSAQSNQVAAIQMCSTDQRDDNLATAARLLEQAAAAGAKLAVLPENFALMGRHEKDKLAIAESPGSGPIQDFLSAIARRLQLWIVAGTVPLAVEGDDRHVWAASLVYCDQGRLAARYDKIHLFDVEVPNINRGGDGGGGGERYRESASIAFGAPNAVVVDTPAGKLGLSVCYDLRFPELYRRLVAAGAEILCVPSAFTERTGRAHWEALLRARAIENQCFVIAPGQAGEHVNGRCTWGHSLILDPWGETLALLESGEGAAVAALPRERLEEVRRTFPALTHRRLE
ncbi:MAG: carbon-nitrogen hydrolase family protein [Nevskia sp.]|nr:carbon-nitrogen hydrolase family protein [Nevskia sp.]